jgi:hypothetical protein
MAKFIKLTNMILNTNNIHKIIIEPNKYYIMSKELSGVGFVFYGNGFGNFSTKDNIIEVHEEEHPNDYKIISKWIENNF